MSKPAPSGPTPSNGSRDVIGTTAAAESAGDTSGLSQTLQGHVDDIRSLIQCGICIRPLYEPFTLGCGHTFCYTCLTSWFGGGRSNKTCPDCRAPVKSEPSPAYLVRAVVQLFTSRAELLDKGETTAEHIHHQREEAEKIDKDKKNPHPREGGLFKGTFNRSRNTIAPPVVDLEDGVLRCPHCSWELEEDSNCMQCGYRPEDGSSTGSSEDLSDIDENSEMTDYVDDEAEDGFNEVDDFGWNDLYDGMPIDAFPFDLHQLYELHRNPYPHHARHVHAPFGHGMPSDDWGQNDTQDSEEEDEEDTDMDSFIDDEEHYGHGEYDTESDRSTVVGGPEYITQEDRYEEHHGFPMSQLGDFVSDSVSEVTTTEDDDHDDDGSSDDESDDEDEPVRPAVSGNRRRPIPYYEVSSSPVQPRLLTSSGHPAQSRTTSNARNRQSVGPSSGRPAQSCGTSHARNGQSAGTSASNAIRLEDDSDEGPVRPTRRARR
ncbi:uncharacterized protein LDX57_006393 [Aspergillus melleus]|uniref:uncharacterized protein n=1 Tax=Aspergillus melleus TaxID=138277 RepID=UPI001E8EDDEC|nr:E3 ubiquitin ligase [Aspergillus melleus]KAH8428705.1 E3 ubiquitin ligase [Aspergillus melleus]